nr:RecName: Full=Acetoacetate decarboxylase; Short=AAD; Short=ADC; AltName: Full=CP 28/CP 29 [Clostridium pasteurianum]
MLKSEVSKQISMPLTAPAF